MPGVCIPALPGCARIVDAAAGGVRVLNPGVEPAAGHFELAEVIVTFEDAAGAAGACDERARFGPEGVDPRRTARLVHGVEGDDLGTLVDGVPEGALVYGTSGALPNPWLVLCPSGPAPTA